MAVLTKEDVRKYCSSMENVSIDMPFHDYNWETARRGDNRKIFACFYERQGYIWVNVKVDPEWREFWRQTFQAVVPAYHMNKEHWNSIILDGTVPDEDIYRMIRESYDLTASKGRQSVGLKRSEFSRDVFACVAAIPKGKVATYGQIAAMAGRPGAARAVGNLLHNAPDEVGCPCHRVVNGKGEMAPPDAFGGEGRQAELLRQEGISVEGGKVDLKVWQMT
ncbi:MAG TPA: methylated-DNA--[protein]-cysteine S-methyltransferase [Candidatus Hungatella pullicola]|nr:methylated-DNA--[protein]-cysteine S-methyltransferase [Candidatus Hungatella pullicola]